MPFAVQNGQTTKVSLRAGLGTALTIILICLNHSAQAIGTADGFVPVGTTSTSSQLGVYGGVSVGTSYTGIAAPTNGLILQGMMGIGSTAPIVSLDLSQKSDAIALPSGYSSQRPSSNVLNGMIRYNSTLAGVEAYENGAWTTLINSGSAGGIYLGIGTNSTNPQKSGDITTGLYSDAAGTVEISSGGTKTFSSSSSYTLFPAGNIGIGTATPPATLTIGNSLTSVGITPLTTTQAQINDAPTITPTILSSFNVEMQPAPSSNSATIYYGSVGNIEIPAASSVNYTGATIGLVGSSYNYGSGSVSTLDAVSGQAHNDSASVITTAKGAQLYALNDTNGTISFAYGAYNSVQNTATIGSGGVITNGYATYSLAKNAYGDTFGTVYGVKTDFTNNGTANTWYNLYLGAPTGTGTITNDYALYSADPGKSYFAGSVGIGTASAGATLDVWNSTAANQMRVMGLGTAGGIVVDNSAGGSQTSIFFKDAGSTKWQLGKGTSNTFFVYDAANAKNFLTVSTTGLTAIGENGQLSLPAAGNVGIGITNPQNLLDVYGGVAIGSGGYAGVTVAPTNGMIVAGSVGIGTTSPTAALHVNGNETITNGALTVPLGSGGAPSITPAGYPTTGIYFNGAAINIIASGTNSGFFSNQGWFGAGGTSPGMSNGSGAGSPRIWPDQQDQKAGVGYDVAGDTSLYADNSGTTAEILRIAGTASDFVNGNVGIGSSSPVVSLDLSQKTDAVALPVGLSSQRPASAINGMIRYNSSLAGVEAYENGAWTTLINSGSAGGIYLGISTNSTNPQKSGDITTGLYSDASQTVEVSAGGTQVLSLSPTYTLIPTGSVGIGTATPGALFDTYSTVGSNLVSAIFENAYTTQAINNSNQIKLRVYNSNVANAEYVGMGGVTDSVTPGSRTTALAFYYGNQTSGFTEGARLSGAGYLGIGTTNPSNIFDVRKGGYGANQNVGLQVGIPSGQWLSRFSVKSDAGGNARTAIDSTNGGTTGVTNEAISIDANANVGIGTLTMGANAKFAVNGGAVIGTYANTTSAAVSNGMIVSGSVGIGTASPTSKLHISGGNVTLDNNQYIRFTNSTGTGSANLIQTSADNFQFTGNTGNLQFSAGTNVVFYTGGSSFSPELARFTSAGLVGIGSSSPVVSLDLSQKSDAIALPQGPSSQRPSTPSNGMIRYNSSLAGVEAYENGSWTTLINSGSAGGIYLGISTSATNPQRSGDVTTGLYSANSGEVDVAASGTQVASFTTSGVNVTSGGLNIAGINGISFPTSDTSAGASIAIGSSALSGQTASGAYQNVAIGYQAIGTGALTSGAAIQNTAIGFSALKSLTTGGGNTSIGRSSSLNLTQGTGNVAVGVKALNANTTGPVNVAIGEFALGNASNINGMTGGGNTAVGYAAGGDPLAGAGVTSGSNNTLLGYYTGASITTGGHNLVLGANVGSTTLSTGTNDILIGTGSGVDTPASSTSNFLNIANLIYGTSIGVQGQGAVGIGTTTPGGMLGVNGGVAIGSTYASTAPPTGGMIVSGNVGIGTATSPGSTLSVNGTVGAYEFGVSNNNQVLVNAGNLATAASANVNRLRFGGGDTNAAYFTIQGPSNVDYLTISSSFVGVGTTSPLDYFEVTAPGTETNVEFGAQPFQIESGHTSTDYALFMGADKNNGVGYIQSVQVATAKKPLALNPQGGSVGIGTTTVPQALSVTGNQYITGYIMSGTTSLSNSSSLMLAKDVSSVGNAQITIQGTSNANQQLLIGYNTTSDYGSIQAVKQGTAYEPLLLDASGGTVGIGTTSPAAAAKLDVWGAIDISGVNGISYPSDFTATASIAIGNSALTGQTAGAQATDNTAIGFYALGSASMTTAAAQNTAVGQGAMRSDISGGQNTAVGAGALYYISSGSYNVAVGQGALQSNTAGTGNEAVGEATMVANTTGSYNAALGVRALQANISGNNNTANGYFALGSNTSGNNNTAMGIKVGNTTLLTGNNNILIGTDATTDTPTSSTSNWLNIGNAIYGYNFYNNNNPAGVPQIAIGSNLTSITAGAVLDLSSNSTAANSSLALPGGPSTTRPTAAINGMIRYNSTTAGVEAYENGAWTTLINSGSSGGIYLGIGTNSTNPQKSGDITTGLYSDAVGTVEISGAGTKTFSSSSSYTLIPTGSVGIGTASPNAKLEVDSASGASTIRISSAGSTSSYTEATDVSSTQFAINKYAASGQTLIDLTPVASDGTSNALIRMFRGTNTTGTKGLLLLHGDNSTTIDTQLGVAGALTYFNASNVAIGTTSQLGSGTLTVNGDINNYSDGSYANFNSSAYNNAAWQGPRISFNRYEGSKTTPTVVQTNDYLGWFDFWGYDGSNVQRGAQFVAAVDATPSAGIVPGRFSINTTSATGSSVTRLVAYSNDNIVMSTNGGKVGIGSSSPLNKLDLSGAASIGYTGQTAPTNGMIVSGSVGIGTASPVMKTEITGTTAAPASSGTAPNGSLRLDGSGSTVALDMGIISGGVGGWLQATNSGNLATTYPLLLNPNGGNVGIGTTSPGALLNVWGTNNPQMQISYDATHSASIRTSSVGDLDLASTSGAIYLGPYNAATGLYVVGSGSGATVGIGTNSTANSLNVYGNVGIGTGYNGLNAPANGMIVAGSVGIGTPSPLTQLHVYQNTNADVQAEIQNYYSGKGAYVNTQANSAFTGYFANSGSTNQGWFFGQWGTGSYVVRDSTNSLTPLTIQSSTPSNTLYLSSAGNIGIGSSSPVASLDLSQKSDAVALPQGPSSQRPSTASNGMIRYNSTLAGVEAYENGSWTTLINSGSTGGITLGTTISTPNPAKSGDLTTGLYSDATQTVEVAANGTQLLSMSPTYHLIPTGSVGIGTTAPGKKLEVRSEILAAVSGVGGAMDISPTAGGAYLYTNSAYNSSTPTVGFTNTMALISGNVGIGSTAPVNKLDINGAAAIGYSGQTAPTNGMIVSGSVGIGTSSSGYNLEAYAGNITYAARFSGINNTATQVDIQNYNGGDAALRLISTVGSYTTGVDNSTGNYVIGPGANYVHALTTKAFNMTSSGNVYIGSTNINSGPNLGVVASSATGIALQVRGAAAGDANIGIQANNGSNSEYWITAGSTNNQLMIGGNGGTEPSSGVLNITSGGRAYVGTTSITSLPTFGVMPLSANAIGVGVTGVVGGDANIALQGNAGSGSSLYWISTGSTLNELMIGGNGASEPSSGVINITGTGSVGIGTTVPQSTFDVWTTNASGLAETLNVVGGTVSSNNYIQINGRALFGYDGTLQDAVVQGGSGKGIEFNVGSSTFGSGQAMVINSGGSVGVGTAIPNYLFDVYTTGAAVANFGYAGLSAQNYIGVDASRAMFGFNGSTANAVVQSAGSKGIEFDVNNNTFGTGQAMVLSSSGNLGIGSTIPVASLDLSQRTDAVALPIGTSGQRPTTGVINGMIRYNSSLAGVEAYENGVWTTLVNSGSTGGIYLGISTSAANPQRSGDATTGFYTAGASKVDVSANGTQIVEWSTSGENIATGALNMNGGNGLSMPSSDTPGGSIAIGTQALRGQTISSSYYNTAVGWTALSSASLPTSAARNTAIGAQSQQSASGAQNTSVGFQSLSNTSGSSNAAVGFAALSADTTGGFNVAMGGWGALVSNQTGGSNVAIGYRAITSNVAGSNNVAIGERALNNMNGGSNNLALGFQVGSTVLGTGNSNILIGTDSSVDTLTSSTSNSLNIGSAIFGSNLYNLSNTGGTGLITIGTSTAASKLGVNGNVSVGTSYVGVAAPANGMVVAGSVGIGTSNPLDVLDIVPASNASTAFVDVHTVNGGVFFEGHQIGGSYNYGSNGIFKAVTDNTTGSSNTYFQGVTGSTTNFSVRADGQGYFAGNVGIGSTSPAGKLTVSMDGTAFGYGQLVLNGATTPTRMLHMGVDTTSNYGWIESANYSVGVQNLVLQPFNGNVGVGTNTPQNKLDIYGGVAIGSASGYAGSTAAPTNGMIVAGSVGIGTSSPVTTLHVYGGSGINPVIEVSGNAGGVNSRLTTYTSANYGLEVQSGGGNPFVAFDNNVYGVAIGSNYAASYAPPTSGMIVAGSVGIGTTTPQSTFDAWTTAGSGLAGSFNVVGGTASSNNYIVFNNGRAMFGYDGNLSDAVVQGNLSKGIEFNVNNATFGSGTVMVITSGGNVGIGSTIPVASLDLSQKTDAIALPIGTSSQRPTTGVINGMIRYNSYLAGVEAYVNGAWTTLGSSGASGSIYLGTATGYTSPQRNGDQTTGLYSSNAGEVDVAASNTQVVAITTNGINMVAGGLNIAGVNGISFPGDYVPDASIAIGSGALGYQTAGTSSIQANVAIGYKSMAGASIGTTSYQNVAIGYFALNRPATATQNVVIGYNAAASETGGGGNVAIGFGALSALVAQNSNTAVGYAALASATGGYNTALGSVAGHGITTGGFNTVLGQSVAYTTLSTGSRNILIGVDGTTDAPLSSTSNWLNIGNAIYGYNLYNSNNVNGVPQIGIGSNLTSITAGAVLDLSSNTTSVNSSLALPVGTSGARPTAAINGMIRYNSSLAGVEAYENGSWTTLINSGSAGGIYLGISTSATNPQRSGDSTTGLYSANSGEVDVAAGGTQVATFTSGGINIANGSLKLAGQNGLNFPADYTTDASIAIGSGALASQTIGTAATQANIAIGYHAMNSASLTTAAINNVAIGFNAMAVGTSGFGNTAVGGNALINLSTGYYNAGFGYGALSAVAGGHYNVGVGPYSAYRVTGNNNTALGYSALNADVSGGSNTAVGYNTLYSATSNGNVAVGASAGGGYPSGGITTGQANLVLGNGVASTTLATGNNNILIGTDTSVDTLAGSTSNSLNIGSTIFGNNMYNNSNLGGTGLISIGTSTTASEFGVNGNVSVGTSYVGIAAPTNGMIVQGSAGFGTSSPSGLLDIASAVSTSQVNIRNTTPTPNSATAEPSPSLLLNGALWNSSSGSVGMSGGLQLNSYTNNANPSVSKLSFLVGSDGGAATEQMYITSQGKFFIAGGGDFSGTSLSTSNTLYLRNTAAATIGTAQSSNQLMLQGHAWNSAQGSEPNEAILQVINNTNNANPTVDRLAISVASANSTPVPVEVISALSSGNVGIGTTSPGSTLSLYASGAVASLDLGSNGYTKDLNLYTDGSGNGYIMANSQGGGYQNLYLGNGSTTRIAIQTATGNVGIGSIAPVNKLDLNGALSIGYTGQTAPTNSMIVAGSVGIGTTSPQQYLHIDSGGNGLVPIIELSGNGGSVAKIGRASQFLSPGGTADLGIMAPATQNMLLGVGGTTYLYLQAGGNVGIGSTSPVDSLDLSQKSDAVSLPQGYSSQRPSTASNGMIRYNSTLAGVEAYENGAWTTLVNSGSTGGIYLGTSISTPNPAKSGDLTTGLYSDATQTVEVAANGNKLLSLSPTYTLIPVGSVGIGTTSPVAQLQLGNQPTQVSNTTGIGYLGLTNSTASTVGGIVSQLGVTISTTATTNYFAMNGQVVLNSAQNTTGNLVGVVGSVYNNNTGTISNAIDLYAPNSTNAGGGSIAKAIGLQIDDQVSGTANYGIFSGVTSGASKYNMYAWGTAQNYFAGNVGIGSTIPVNKLDINGAAAIGYTGQTAPTNGMIVSGSVGIGTPSPRQNLSIGASLDIYSGSSNTPTVPSIRGSGINNLVLSAYSTGTVYLNGDSGTGGVIFGNGAGSTVGVWTASGSVGIGSSSPINKLDINGAAAIGYTGQTAPTNGMLVAGNVYIGTASYGGSPNLGVIGNTASGPTMYLRGMTGGDANLVLQSNNASGNAYWITAGTSGSQSLMIGGNGSTEPSLGAINITYQGVVGIGTGTISSSNKLEINGAATVGYTNTAAPTNGMIVSGSVGIGTASPTGNLQIYSGVQTTSVPALNITQTWNAGGTTFDAPLFENITNTAYASGSKIIDLQVGGTSVFTISGKGAGGGGTTTFADSYVGDDIGNSWRLQRSTASATTPTFLPNSGDTKAGIGADVSGDVSVITDNAGTATEMLRFTGTASDFISGNVGIGSTIPAFALDVVGQEILGGVGNAGRITFRRSSDAVANGQIGYASSGESSNISLSANGGAGYLTFFTANNERMRIDSSGNLGIGSTIPVTSLDLSQKTDAVALPVGLSSQRPASAINGMIRYNSSLAGVEAYENGIWTTLVNSGSTGGIYLGISTSAANPQRTGDTTTGFYTAGSGKVDVTVSGNQIVEWSTSGENLATGGLNIAGQNGLSFPADFTTDGSIAIGSGVLVGQALGTSTGQINIGIGYKALNAGSMTGTGNIAVGYSALSVNSSGSNNVAIGISAGRGNLTGSNNVALGPNALYSNQSNANNTAVGYNALYSATGAGNTAVGFDAGGTGATGLTTGQHNSLFGYGVGRTILSTGSYNILIGTDNTVDTLAAGTNNFLDIGSAIYGTNLASGGNLNGTGLITIGTSTTASQFGVNGNVSIGTSYVGIAAPTNGMIVQGNVGIGTSSTTTPLFIVAPTATTALLKIENNDYVPGTTGSGMYMVTGAASGNTTFGIQATINGGANGGSLLLNQTGGSVGISTTSPSGTLDVAASGGSSVFVRDSAGTAGTIKIINAAGGNYIESGLTTTAASAAPLYFTNMVGSNTWMTIGSTGNVGIGTASPGAILHSYGTTEQLRLGYDAADYTSFTVNSAGSLTISPSSNVMTINATNLLVKEIQTASGYAYSSLGVTYLDSASGQPILFRPGATELVRIAPTTGNVGIGSTSPISSLDLSQKNDAIALPIGTSGQRPSPATNGMIRYNSSLAGVEAYANGAWTTLGSGSGGSVSLGTATGYANPQRSGDQTTGFYSASAGKVDVSTSNTQIVEWSTSGENIVTGSLNIAGGNAISFPADLAPGDSIAIGSGALIGQTVAGGSISNNTAIGAYAIGSASLTTAAINNTGIGPGTLKSLTTGTYNTGVGSGALQGLQSTPLTGGANTGVGALTLFAIQGSANSDTGVGNYALEYMTTGAGNTAVGYASMLSVNGSGITGGNNTSIGANALRSIITTGSQNTAIGAGAGRGITTGFDNTFIGYNVGSANPTTGSGDILIGTDGTTTTSASGTSNWMNIGNAIYGYNLYNSTNATGVPQIAIGSNLTSVTAGAVLDLSSNTTSANSSLILPSGTSAARPSPATNGMIRYNSSTPAVEAYVNNAWSSLGSGGSSQWTTSGSNIYYTIGSVAIGTTSPGVYELNVNGTAPSYIAATGATGGLAIGTSMNTSYYLTVGSNVISSGYFIFSDERLKHDIQSFDRNGIDIVDALRPVHFKWNKDNRSDFGVIAQEVQKVLPEIVNTDHEGFMQVSYDKLVLPVIEAVKELAAKTRDLETKVVNLDMWKNHVDEQMRTLDKRMHELERRNQELEERNKKLDEQLRHLTNEPAHHPAEGAAP